MNSSMDKVAMITGAAAGIGKASARRFANQGYSLVLNDQSASELEKIEEELEQTGTDCISVCGDIADAETTALMAEEAKKKWGRIDSLVANAGIQDGGSLLETDEAAWDRLLSINLKGVSWSCKAALPLMLENNKGAIVIISSINAVVGSPAMAAYDASKSAVLGLMRSLAIDYGRQGVRVNAVSPGNTITDFHINRMAEQGVDIEQLRQMTRGYALLDRAAEPEEIANAVYFLASEKASFITGHNLLVDGGYSLSRNQG